MPHKLKIWLNLFLGLVAAGAAGQAPTDNPYSAHYKTGKHWTDALRWAKVWDASRVQGLIGAGQAVDSVVLHRTINEISAEGGVLYFPAGTYYFNYDVMLKSNVVIRGERFKAAIGTAAGAPQPPTRFEFPKYEPAASGAGTPNGTAFKQFTADEKGAANFGLVYLDINRAALGFYTKWPEHFHENVLIFSVRQNNVASPDPTVPSKVQSDEQHGWQRWPAWYKENMVVCVKSNGIIANCRLNDQVTDDFAQPGYLTNEGYLFREDTLRFRYTYHRGITMYVKEAGGGSSIRDTYIRSTRHFEKIGTPKVKPLVKNNVLEDTPDEREFALVTREGNLAHAAINDAKKLFDVQQYVFGPGDTLTYRLLKPETYDPAKTYPLVLFLHGAGEGVGIKSADHTDHFVQVFTTPEARKNYPCFVIIPHLPVAGRWTTVRPDDSATAPVRNALKLIGRLSETYRVDSRKLYITGISAGGNGTWETIIRYPDLFAAAVPMASYFNFTADQMQRIRKVPVFITAGAKDIHIPVEYTRAMVARLKKADIQPRYKEYHDVGHFSWVPLYTDEEFLPWLFAQARP